MSLNFARAISSSFALLLLFGCTLAQQTVPAPSPGKEAFEQYTKELSSIYAIVTAAADRTQTQLSESVEPRLDDLAGALNLIQKDLQTCLQPQTPAPQVCDDRPVLLNDERMVVGEVEWVRIAPPGILMSARIDTGAQSSSIHAGKISRFERDGDEWISFELNIDEQPVTIERPILRHVRVFQQSDKDGSRRPVVAMRIIVGNVTDSFEFTLADRAHLEHDMILGRNFLTDLAVVDVGREYVQPRPQ